jgi:hypothetical protein
MVSWKISHNKELGIIRIEESKNLPEARNVSHIRTQGMHTQNVPFKTQP